VLMERSRDFVLSERITRTVGVENFFELPDRAEPPRSLGHRIVTDAAWVYPVGIASSVVVAPRIAELPMELRVIISTLLITMVMRLAVGPLRSKLRSKRTM
jgi:antibiotic biosynthesis monooxygenase (ABM) superfamily enzyme